MSPNILICKSEQELEAQFSDDFIVNIDGKKAMTLRQFYEEAAYLLDIPDFGFTLDELSDSLSDLQWLEENRIVLYFTNTEIFMSKERDPAKIAGVINTLDAVAEDWKWVEEGLNDEKEIIIVFEDSHRIQKILEQESINYKIMDSLNQ
ncbi:barstar family protein [Spirosoma spitsbergense]|uniref:barstar family protein n=1 Tax=Spirosoma spitsbergense TaxID=431554 RepID=UPI00036DD080|nr:barstar family protein [Spirosoma spitsbergense]